MTQIDPEREGQRLAVLYAGQTNEELENVAAQAPELTDIARETLRAELTKRGLYVGQLDEDTGADGHDEAEFRDLVTLRTFSTLTEAEMAKGALDSAGIESFLFDENVGRIYLVNVVGGVRLRVDAPNVEAANAALEEAAIPDDAMEASDSSDESST